MAITPENVQQLRTAAATIRENGLAKGQYRNESDPLTPKTECPHCAMGAIYDAIEPGAWKMGVLDNGNNARLTALAKPLFVEMAITLVEEDETQAFKHYAPQSDWFAIISDFNDRIRTTEEDVAGVLDRTADRLEA